jgi:hypothetical protein
MSVNASKTKFIIFKTHNKPVNPLDCNIVYNSTEIGLPNDPNMIVPIDRSLTKAMKNTSTSLVFYLMKT